jgi:hypothetical protein
MLYFAVQIGDQCWAGLVAYTVLCSTMLLRGNGTHELKWRANTKALPGDSIYLVVKLDY